MKVKESLERYRKNTTLIATLKAEIQTVEHSMENDEVLELLIQKKEKYIDKWMPKGPRNAKESPVENSVLLKEKARGELEKQKRELEAEAWLLEREQRRIEIALNALPKQQEYVIRCKYFEKMSWSEIEYKFNEKFQDVEYISSGALRKRMDESILIIGSILKPLLQKNIFGQ